MNTKIINKVIDLVADNFEVGDIDGFNAITFDENKASELSLNHTDTMLALATQIVACLSKFSDEVSTDNLRFLLNQKRTRNSFVNAVSDGNTTYTDDDLNFFIQSVFEQVFNDSYFEINSNASVDIPGIADKELPKYIASIYEQISGNSSNANDYGITFQDTLPDDIEPVVLPKNIAPCITQDTFLAKNGEKRPTIAFIVERLISDFGLCTLGDKKRYAIYDRDTQHWVCGEDYVIDIAVRKIFKHINSKDIKEITTRINLPSTLKHYDEVPTKYIAFNNCIVDFMNLDTDGKPKVYKLNPAFRICDVVPHDYNPNADNTLVSKVLHDDICQSDDVKFLSVCEVVGGTLCRKGTSFIALISSQNKYSNAANGKSTFTDGLRAIWGGDTSPYVTTVQPSKLGGSDNKFALAGLVNSRVNVAGDVSTDFVSNDVLSNLKDIVEGRSVTVEQKYKDSYSASCVSQFVCSANEWGTWSIDQGVERRLLFIPFNNHFSPEDDGFIRNISQVLWGNENNVQALINYGLSALKGLVEREYEPTRCSEHFDCMKDFCTTSSVVQQWANDRGYTKAFFTNRVPVNLIQPNVEYTQSELMAIREQIFGVGPLENIQNKRVVMTIQKLFADFNIWCINHNYKKRVLQTFKTDMETTFHIDADRNSSNVQGTKKQSAKCGYKGSGLDTRQFFRQTTLDGQREFTFEHQDPNKNFEELEELEPWLSYEDINQIALDIKEQGATNIPDNYFDNLALAVVKGDGEDIVSLENLMQKKEGLEKQLAALNAEIEKKCGKEIADFHRELEIAW